MHSHQIGIGSIRGFNVEGYLKGRRNTSRDVNVTAKLMRFLAIQVPRPLDPPITAAPTGDRRELTILALNHWPLLEDDRRRDWMPADVTRG